MTDERKDPVLLVEWNGSSELRAEFMGDFELYAAFQREIPDVRVKFAPSVAKQERF